MITNQKDLAAALGVQNLDPKEQEAILNELDDVVVEGVIVRMLEKMDEATAAEFEKLLDQDASEEEIEAFIKLHVPDSDVIVQETIAELGDDILAETGK